MTHAENAEWWSAKAHELGNQAERLTIERDTARQERDTALERLAAAEKREAALREPAQTAADLLEQHRDYMYESCSDFGVRTMNCINDLRAALAATEPGQEGAGT